jgi:uncharacterized protein
MKKILSLWVIVLIFFAQSIFAFDIPSRPNTYVNDYAGVLSSSELGSLEEKVESFEKTSTNEIAVVIIPTLDGDTIENVANELFTSWGIGKKDKNNGVLFLASIEDHRMRIEVGYGLEGALTDVGTAYIQDTLVSPSFKEGKYYEGINSMLDAVIGLVKGEFTVPDNTNIQKDISFIFHNFWYVLFFLMFAFQFLAAILGRSKSWWAGGVVGGVFGLINILINFFALALFVNLVITGALIGLGLLFDYFVSKKYKSWKDKGGGGNPPWFIGGGGFGGGSSSGSSFGGFGGGSSGGGGSSSSW